MKQNGKNKSFQTSNSFSRILTNALFGFALLIIITINLFSFFQMSRFIKSNQWVIHTYQVIQSITNIYLNIVEIESAERNFLLNHNQTNMEEIEQNKKAIEKNLARSKELTIDNNKQQKKIDQLEKILKERIGYIRENTMLETQAKNWELSNSSHELIKKISALIEDISDTELNLLDERNAFSLHNLKELNFIFLCASIGSIVIFLLGGVLLNINLLSREKYLLEKKRNETLLNGIIDGTTDIILVLDLNFCFVTFNKSFEHEFKTLFGKRPMIGASMIDLLAHLPMEQDKIIKLWKRALEGKEEFSLIGEFGGTPENKNFYECNFSSIYDEKDVLIGAAAICRNIEHRIESEKFLKTTNEKLEHAYHELKQHYAEIYLLNEMENSLQSCNSIDETLIIINRYCQKLLPFSAGAVYLINPSRNYLELKTEWNSPHALEKVFSPNQCWGLRQGKNYFYINNSTCLTCEHIRAEESLSYLCSPLLAQNDIIGMLHIEIINSPDLSENETTELFKKNELLIKNLAVQLALAIANIQLREILKSRSIRDSLTGLYNRMYLNEFLERDLHRAKRNNFSVAIVMMDIDRFKKINDIYGHDAGDMVLKNLGKILQENMRGGDIACRYGGEEFLLIFSETDREVAIEIVEKLRKQINHMEVGIRGVILDKITASYGLAMFPADGTTVDALTLAADQALYQSKINGRNRLTIYHNLKE